MGDRASSARTQIICPSFLSRQPFRGWHSVGGFHCRSFRTGCLFSIFDEVEVTRMSRALVIGISGVTCAGKSSLTKILKNMFPHTAVICQDDFYHSHEALLPKSPDENGAITNWDSLKSIDMVSMTEKVKSTIREIQSGKLLIVDGFLIFNYPPLAELCDLKFFLTLDYEQCYTRRQERFYDSPDPPDYFQNYVWPMYCRHLKEMQEQSYSTNIQYLDGNVPLEENLNIILKSIKLWKI